MTETVKSIRHIVAANLGIDEESLDQDKPMSEFGIDSASQVELLFLIEEHFNVRIFETRTPIKTIKELGDAVDVLKNNQSNI